MKGSKGGVKIKSVHLILAKEMEKGKMIEFYQRNKIAVKFSYLLFFFFLLFFVQLYIIQLFIDAKISYALS